MPACAGIRSGKGKDGVRTGTTHRTLVNNACNVCWDRLALVANHSINKKNPAGGKAFAIEWNPLKSIVSAIHCGGVSSSKNQWKLNVFGSLKNESYELWLENLAKAGRASKNESYELWLENLAKAGRALFPKSIKICYIPQTSHFWPTYLGFSLTRTLEKHR